MSNDPRVLGDCLVRSIEAQRAEAPDTEVIVIENSANQFSTAGAALNHGASLARHDVCVFVHQDVYLHSMVRVEEAAGELMADGEIGLLGPVGITASGRVLGRVRDRVVFIGCDLDGFVDVDSVDELFLMVRRTQVLAEPLSEDPDLAWHAYAVEYGARVRRAGRRVVAARVPVTHNSLTINLARLTEGHRKVATDYPEQLPIVTTCGVIGRAPAQHARLLAGQRWRYRWLKGSRRAYGMSRVLGSPAAVLADIRFDVDGVLEESGEDELAVGALLPAGPDSAHYADEVALARHDRTFALRALCAPDLLDWSAECELAGRSMLLTNVDREFLARFGERPWAGDAVLGYSEGTGFWVLQGPVARVSPAAWCLPQARPLGLRAAARR